MARPMQRRLRNYFANGRPFVAFLIGAGQADRVRVQSLYVYDPDRTDRTVDEHAETGRGGLLTTPLVRP